MNSNRPKLGLLVMHYGTPSSIEEVLPYYTHIRRGRTPPQDLYDDLVRRYEAIGGPSPLTKISEDQAAIIQKGLINRGFPVQLYIGCKHTHPFVSEAVEQMAKDGIDEAVAIVLAPHYSSYSIESYKKYAFEARDQVKPAMKLSMIERWGMMPEYIEALRQRLADQLTGLNLDETLVIFSAHSLPMKIMSTGDPYVSELLDTSRRVAEACGIPHWEFAFQSASTTGEPWLGPDILEVIEAKKSEYKNIVSCTVGFVSDHLEVLYDLGIETREKCAELGLNFRLCEVLNVDIPCLDALAGRLSELFECASVGV